MTLLLQFIHDTAPVPFHCVGTDFGVFVSTNGGARWEVVGGNMPSVQVSDLQINVRDNIIIASTYGRGMWVFDASRVVLK